MSFIQNIERNERGIIMKKLVGLMVMIIMGALLVGCGDKKEIKPSSNEEKVYMIATDATYAPFEFEVDGKYQGIDIEILEKVAEIKGFKYELKPMNFKGIIPGIQSNQLDAAIAGISITDERKEVLDFSTGYFESGVSAVAASGKEIEDFTGMVFAVKKGTAGAAYAETVEGAEMKYFDNSPSMFQAVINGNADITFEDYPVIAYKIALDDKKELQIVGEKLTNVDYGFAVKKGENQELLQMFNEGLQEIKDNGTYDAIVNKYIGGK